MFHRLPTSHLHPVLAILGSLAIGIRMAATISGAQDTGPRGLTLVHAGLLHGTTDIAITAVIGGVNYCDGRRPSKASWSKTRMPSRVTGRGL